MPLSGKRGLFPLKAKGEGKMFQHEWRKEGGERGKGL